MVNELKKAFSPYYSKENTEINDSILDLVDDICVKQIEPFAQQMDKTGVSLENGKVILPEPMPKIYETLAKNDVLGLTVPEKYDGTGLSFALQHGVIDRISRADASTAVGIALQGALIDYIDYFGSEELKEKYLAQLARGKKLGGFLYTEPGSGSDLGSVSTKAVKEGDKYVINGNKIFISNAGISDTYTLLASTDPSKGSRGLTAFILDTEQSDGFNVLRLEEKMGLHASPTGQVSFENFEIPVENRLGEENKGFGIILHGLSVSRSGIGAQAVGIAEAAYRKAMEYVNQRKQFGKKINDFQATQWKIADMITKIAIARNYYIYATRLKDMGKPFFKESSIAKLYGSEMAQNVTWEAVQMLGGNGFIKEYDVERYMRDCRVTTIYEGTSEVQRLIISREEMSKFNQ